MGAAENVVPIKSVAILQRRLRDPAHNVSIKSDIGVLIVAGVFAGIVIFWLQIAFADHVGVRRAILDFANRVFALHANDPIGSRLVGEIWSVGIAAWSTWFVQSIGSRSSVPSARSVVSAADNRGTTNIFLKLVP